MRRLRLAGDLSPGLAFLGLALWISPAWGQNPGTGGAATHEASPSEPEPHQAAETPSAQPGAAGTGERPSDAVASEEPDSKRPASQGGAPPGGDAASTSRPRETEPPDAGAPAPASPGSSDTELAGEAAPPVTDPQAPAAPAADAPEPDDSGYSKRAPSDAGLVEERHTPSDFLVAAMLESSLVLGDEAEFAGTFGMQGFGIEFAYLGLAPFRLGAGISWHSIAETREDETFVTDEATYTGRMIKELSYTPLLVKVGYSLGASQRTLRPGEKPKPTPHLAFGIGASRAARRVDVGITGLIRDSWHLSLVPEVGVDIPVGPVKLVAVGRFNLVLPDAGYDLQTYANLCFGVAFD